MKSLFISLILALLCTPSFAQETENQKPSLEQTQMWLKQKSESNGVGRWPANRYEVEFPDSCHMTFIEMGTDTAAIDKLTLEFAIIDFEKASKKVNKNGTLVIEVGKIELRFIPNDPNDFYTRYIKALKRMKELCGGVDDGLF